MSCVRWWTRTALIREAELIEVMEVVAACRHAKDNKFLELAVSGKANYVVSGDRHLLALHPFRGIAILTPNDFLAAARRRTRRPR